MLIAIFTSCKYKAENRATQLQKETSGVFGNSSQFDKLPVYLLSTFLITGTKN